jgi:predicted glutamine amidotransferase
MCHLAYCPPGATPTEDHLINAATSNDDGHGFAFVVGKGLLTYKSMDAVDAIENFMTTRERYPDVPALWHSRWATHGVVDEYNVHPFFVSNDASTVLAHNGILNNLQMSKKERRSDTRFFAESIFPQAGHLDDPETHNRMKKWLNSGKFVILTTNKKYEKSAYIFGEDNGTWHGTTNVWHSNYDYLPTMTKYAGVTGYGSGYAGGWGDDDYDRYWDARSVETIGKKFMESKGAFEMPKCNLCDDDEGFDPASNFCWTCDHCNDCLKLIPECDCYDSARSAHSVTESGRQVARKHDDDELDEYPSMRPYHCSY